MHMHITSDYELKEWDHIFSAMVTKHSYCPEAYFGLGKIYFSRNHLTKALEMFEHALHGTKRDPVYCLWAAFTLLYLYRRAKKIDKKISIAIRIEEYTLEWLGMNNHDINALFILLYLVLDVTTNLSNSGFEPQYSPEDLAVWAKEIDNYKGYLAWVEVYLHRGNKRFD